MNKKSREETLREILQNCGITNYGVTDFAKVSEDLINCRGKNRIPPNAKSVIVTVFPYLVKNCESNLSRYAQVPDYHASLLPHLSCAVESMTKEFGGNSVCFIDNSPIPEVYAAACAGLGIIGDHGLLITPEYGSYVFIGEIITDLQFKAETRPVSFCAHCGRCRDACPAHVLPSGNKIHCLSSITQKKGGLSPEQIRLIRENKSVWGCDLCQTACPHNQSVSCTALPVFIDGHRPNYFRGEDPDCRAYNWRPRNVIERNYDIVFGERKD